jgi:ferric-dicitrate binding protein FerR (iron transport regulator)
MTHTKEIIEKYLKSKADKSTQQTFVDWLSMSVDEELKEELLRNEWEKDECLTEENVSRSYNKVMAKIRRRSFSRWMKYVACSVAASIVVAATLYICLPRIEKPADSPLAEYSMKMTECYVAYGEKKVVTLSDSTTVTLNSGSLLIYPEEFTSSERKVYLTGEAIFNVSKNDACPFIVTTPDLKIKVHGTIFNVSSYVDGACATTTLKEGSVSVFDQKGDQYLLSPNQTLRYAKDSGKVSVVQADIEDAFAWNEGKLYFKSEYIHTIINEIERYYGIRVYLTTSRYDNERLTAKFVHGETVEEMMTTLGLLLPGMKWNMENSIVYIK